MGLGLALGPGYEVRESSAAAAASPAKGFRADYGFVATMDRQIRCNPKRYVGYRITNSWDEIVETLPGAPVSTDIELGAHMREFESMVRRDTDEIYTRLDDEQGQRQLLAGRVNMLFRDRRAHAHIRQLMETEAGICQRSQSYSQRTVGGRERSTDYSDLDCYTDTTERDDSTLGTGHHTAGAGDSLTGISDDITGAEMAEAEASRVRNGNNSNGTEGVVGLTRWFEKMEYVFSISNCPATSQVKFAACTLQEDALTWWNAHVKTTTTEAAHAIPWAALKKMMTDKYCLRGEIKKIETEMWNLKVKGIDVVAYSRRFQQLALMCSRMFPKEIDKVEKYIGGLPDMILGSVKASKSKTMQEVIEFTTELMEDKTHAYAECQAKRKRKNEDLSKNNQN
ncbi:reverse transcriptase domain-containing protein [Tanacetum coccineum]